MSNDVFTGYRYLMDMHDNRQYILRYAHGTPVSLDIVNGDGSAGQCDPHEEILAYDDKISKKKTHNGATFQLCAYRIQAGPDNILVNTTPVIYTVGKDPEIWVYEDADIYFNQDDDNINATKAAGFHIKDQLALHLRESQMTWVQDGPSAYPTVLHDDLCDLNILPKHGDRATKARGEALPASLNNRNAANDLQLQSMPFNARDKIWTFDIARPLTFDSVKAVIPTQDAKIGTQNAYKRKTGLILKI